MSKTSETQRLQRLAALGDPDAAKALARHARRRGHAPEWEEAIVARAELYQAVAQGLRTVATSLERHDPVRAQQDKAQEQMEAAWLQVFELRWQALGLGDTLAALAGSPPAALLTEMSEGHETMLEALRDLKSDRSHAIQHDWLAAIAQHMRRLLVALEDAESGEGQLELERLEAVALEHHALVRGLMDLFEGHVLWAVKNLSAACWKDSVAFVLWSVYGHSERRPSAGAAIHALLRDPGEGVQYLGRRPARYWLRLTVVADGQTLGPWGVERVARTWAAVVADQNPEFSAMAEYWSHQEWVPSQLLESGDPEAIGAEVIGRLVAGR